MSPLTIRRVVSAVGKRLWRRVELCIYVCPAERARTLAYVPRLRRDHFADLDACTAWSYEHMTRDQYLANVASRREGGNHHFYSLVENGELVHYGWLTARQERAPDQLIGLVFVPPPGSAALWDYFTHPSARGRGLYRESLRQCLHDAVDIDGASNVFIYVYADNAVSRRAIESAGFEYLGSLVMERRLFFTRRYATTAGHALDVRQLADRSPARVKVLKASAAAPARSAAGVPGFGPAPHRRSR